MNLNISFSLSLSLSLSLFFSFKLEQIFHLRSGPKVAGLLTVKVTQRGGAGRD